MAHENIEQTVLGLSRGIADEAVVIGSSAASLMLPGFRASHDIDLAVSQEAFAHLRGMAGWQETSDGRLLKDGLDIGTGWGERASAECLATRSWRTDSGVQVAGLPDVYAYKDKRSSAVDKADNAFIKQYLTDPTRVPFAAKHIPCEVAAAGQCLPEELRDLDEAAAAIQLAANGLHIVYTLYGHPDIRNTNKIMGDLEQPEFFVPATYHNGFDLVADSKLLQKHLANIDAPIADRLKALAIEPYTDAIYGNGRFADNPGGHDELRSAQLLRGHALQLGFIPDDADMMHDAVMGSTFDEASGTQRGSRAASVITRGVVAVDLQVLSEPESVEQSIALAIEDGFSARYDRARTIGKVLNAHGERVNTIHSGLELIDRYADERSDDAPSGPTVMQFFGHRLQNNAGFHRAHCYPDGWTLDNPTIRGLHADKLKMLSGLLLNRKISAVDAYHEAVAHTALLTK